MVTEETTKELTLLEQAKAKQKQLEEALAMLDDIGWKVDWALDFCNYSDIDETLTPLSYAVSEAHEEIEQKLEALLEAVEKYEEEQHFALAQVDSDSDLKYHLE